MPSSSFAAMTDRDLSAILSFIANYPKQDRDLGHSRYGLMTRMGQFRFSHMNEGEVVALYQYLQAR